MINAIILSSFFIVALFIANYTSYEFNMILKERRYTTALKGIAIIIIMLGHLSGTWTNIFTPFGGIGVALFLLLSGYGLSESYKRNKLNRFWQKRFSRVWIPYFIIITLLFCFWYSDYFLLDYILDIICIKTSYWYIGFMIRCYIVFWISYKFLYKYRLYILFFYGITTIFYMSGTSGEQPLSFFVGVLFSEKSIKLDGNKFTSWKYIILFLIIGALFLAVKQTSWFRVFVQDAGLIIPTNIIQSFIKLPLALFIMMVMVHIKCLHRNVLLLFTGMISYELYLSHYPFYGSFNYNFYYALTLIAFCYILSWFFYMFNCFISRLINKKT